VRLDPREEAFFCAADSYLALGRTEDALRAVNKAIEIGAQYTPLKNPEVIYRLGRVHLAKGEYEAALAKFDEVLKSGTNHVGAVLWKAYLLSACPDAKFRNGLNAGELCLRKLKVRPDEEIQQYFVSAAAHAEGKPLRSKDFGFLP
jgi:tetratricopeptide (TPR) repeat protein